MLPVGENGEISVYKCRVKNLVVVLKKKKRKPNVSLYRRTWLDYLLVLGKEG